MKTKTTAIQPNIARIALPALLAGLLLPAIPATRADVPVYENKISLYGYAAGSASYDWQARAQGEPDTSKSTFALDAAKLGLAFDFSPLTARISAYVPSTEMDGGKSVYLLEANATYAMRRGAEVTFGRFQSWIGYEAFDIPARNFLTPATTERLSIIPSFHEGIKCENTSGSYTYGLALLDSIYPAPGESYSGNSNISDGFAFEARVSRKGDNFSWTVNAGFQKNNLGGNTDTWVADGHAEYLFPGTQTTLGAEACVKTEEPFYLNAQGYTLTNNRTNTYFGLVTLRRKMSDNDTLSLRLSAGHEKVAVYKGQAVYADGTSVYHGGTKVLFTKFSAGFSHTFNKHLDIRGEFSFTNYTNTRQGAGQIAHETYAGVQAVLKL